MARIWKLTTLLGGILMVAQSALASCPSVPTSLRFTALNSGTELLDNSTGLVWARCEVGYQWSGSACVGVSNPYFTQEAALAYAAPLTGWRMPNRRELNSLVDRGCSDPAIDSAAFPQNNSLPYWTSTPLAGKSSDAWFIDFYAGILANQGRTINSSVRLVRIP